MIFLIIQWTFLIISTVYVYKTAKGNGHNALFWTSMNVFGYLIAPFILNLLVGMVLGLAVLGELLTMESALTVGWFFSLVTFALGVGCVLWILRRVSNLSEDADFVAPPEPGMFDLD